MRRIESIIRWGALTLGLLLVGPLAQAQDPGWTVDPAAYDTSMPLTAAVVIDGQQADHVNNSLAAFVGEEVRGVVASSVIDGRTVYLLLVYANASELTAGLPTLTFSFYHAATNTTYDLLNTLTYEPDAPVGSVTAPYVLTNAAVSGAPTWDFDPTAFDGSMNLVGSVYDSGQALSHPDDLLAAFVGTELRGVAGPTFLNGQPVFFLTVHGADTDGTVSFQHFDAAAGQVRDLPETLAFSSGYVSGSPTAPFVWNVGASFNRPSWVADLGALDTSALGTMSLVGAVFVEGLRAAHPGDLVAAFVGEALRGVATPTLVDGQAVYFLTVYGNDGDTVDFKTYAFDPTEGTQQTHEVAEWLTFATGALVGEPSSPVALRNGLAAGGGPADWLAFDPEGLTGLAGTMDVAGTLQVESLYVGETLVEDVPAAHPDDLVAAFVGEELRGVAPLTIIGGRGYFFLLIHGTDTDATPVTFQAYLGMVDTVVDLPETLAYVSNDRVGSTSTPYFWQAPAIPLTFTVDDTGTTATMDVNGEIQLGTGAAPAGMRSLTAEDVGVGDQVIAFVGDQSRGVSTLEAGDGSALVFTMTVAGNEEETVLFKTYAPTTNTLLVVEETVSFAGGSILGDPTDPVPLTASQPIQVDLRVMLEGAYDTEGRMRTDLADQGLMPLAQPFSDPVFEGTPLFHPGAEVLTAVPAEAVDWVLLELRTEPIAPTVVIRRAAILLADGSVVYTDGVSPVRFATIASGSYYVVVRHRNHLPVMSAVPVALGPQAVRYDFTKSGSQASGMNAQVAIAPGLFGFLTGDANGSGGITATDDALWLTDNGTLGYFLADFDLSGGVTATDYVVWLINNGKASQVSE